MLPKDPIKALEHRRRISEARKGRHLSEETKRKLSELNKGKPGYWKGKKLPDSARQKLREARLGKPRSAESITKQSNSLKGRKFTEEHKRKISAANKGQIVTEEQRRKQSVAMTGRKTGPRPEEVRKKISQSHKGKIFSPEHCQHIRESKVGLVVTDETREKMSLGNILRQNEIWYGGVKYDQDRKYCEAWTKEFRGRIRNYWDHKSVLSGKTKEDNNGRLLSCHHVYYQPKACCIWDEDEQGYFAIIDGHRYYINGDPNKFVTLTQSEHSFAAFNKLEWVKLFEDLIEKQGGKCYYTKEDMLENKELINRHPDMLRHTYSSE